MIDPEEEARKRKAKKESDPCYKIDDDDEEVNCEDLCWTAKVVFVDGDTGIRWIR